MSHTQNYSSLTSFRTVKQITLDTIPSSLKCSKQRNIFLTCDLDWCHEVVLADTLDLIERYNAKATLFVTNRLSGLDLIKGNNNLELGIHPNFDSLFSSKKSQQNAERIIDDLLEIVTDAKSVRSHSLVQGGGLTSIFLRKGLTHESNIKIPFSVSKCIMPFRHASGMIMCPFQWGDYSDHAVPFETLMPLPEYFMVNFHPIHIFLNTESLDRYERTRPLHRNPTELIKHRYDGYGTRHRLIELFEIANIS